MKENTFENNKKRCGDQEIWLSDVCLLRVLWVLPSRDWCVARFAQHTSVVDSVAVVNKMC